MNKTENEFYKLGAQGVFKTFNAIAIKTKNKELEKLVELIQETFEEHLKIIEPEIIKTNEEIDPYKNHMTKIEKLSESYEAFSKSPVYSSGCLSDDIIDLRMMIGEVIDYLKEKD